MTTPWLSWGQKQGSTLFQGIDYLSLTLSPGPPSTATLVVHLQRPWLSGPPDPQPPAFSAESFSLTGGLRVTDLAFDYVGEDKNEQTVTLLIHGTGDASEYTLTLLDGGEHPVHPFFGAATFVFTIDCERGDCRPLAAKPPRPRRPRPAIDLLTKDYAGFVQLLGDWVRVRNPSWADLSPASLERVLVELLAHHGDMLSYYQDRVANEAFIDTASQRASLRSHATLLGTRLFDGAAARTLLAFTTSDDGYLPAEIEVTTPFGAGGSDVVFWLTERTRVLALHNHLQVASWPGAADAVIPAGAAEVLLWGPVENLLVGQRLAFVQGDFAAIPTAGDPPIPPAQVVTITAARRDRLPGWTALPTDAEHTNLSDVTVVSFEPPLTTEVRPAWGQKDALHIHGNLGSAEFGKLVVDAFSAYPDSEPTTGNPPPNKVLLTEEACLRDRHSFTLERRPGFSQAFLRALRLPMGPVVFRATETAAGLTVSSAAPPRRPP